jgi:hypothetical protein
MFKEDVSNTCLLGLQEQNSIVHTLVDENKVPLSSPLDSLIYFNELGQIEVN